MFRISYNDGGSYSLVVNGVACTYEYRNVWEAIAEARRINRKEAMILEESCI